jgi:hypothetical protein
MSVTVRRPASIGLIFLCALIGVLLVSSAPALAAAPEAPEVTVESPVHAETANLRGILNPNAKAPSEAGTYEFLYKASKTECEGGGKAPESPGLSLGLEREEVTEGLSGLFPNTEYTVCLRAENTKGEAVVSPPVTFRTSAAAPAVAGEASSNVGSTTATVSAQIDPGGTPTTYHVEYGTSVAYGSSTPEASLPASTTPVGALGQLTGLQPQTLYHFRFVAQNALGGTQGADVSFTTVQAGGAGALTLPDERVYELVSSPNSNQDVYAPSEAAEGTTPQEDFNTERAVRASADGGAVAYLGDPPAGEGGGGAGLLGNGLGNAWLGTRTPAGWIAKSIQPPVTAAGGFGNFTQYEAFSNDLTAAIIRGEQLTADVAPTCSLYSRTGDDGSFHALVIATQTSGHCGNQTGAVAGGSADGSHLLFEDEGALTPGAAEAAEGQFNLYDSTAGQPHLVNVLPNGKTDPNATFGSPASSQNFNKPDFSNVISVDGSRIFWTDLSTGGLYVRENDIQPQSPLGVKGECTVPADACTVQVDATQGPGSSGGGRFLTASSDGTRVFFTDCSRLTKDSTSTAAS